MKLDELFTQNESKTLEFKENCLSKDKILNTVVSFANTSGGKIIIGIEDQTKHVVGIASPYDEEEKLNSIISDSLTPGLIFNIEIIPWRDTHLIIIDVPMSGTKPHYIASKGIEKSCYVRVGSSNRLADLNMRESIKRSQHAHSYDEEVCLEAVNAVDTADIKEAFESIRTITLENM